MSVPVRAGRLRHRITIQEIVETKNVYGEPTRSFRTFAIRWADVAPISGGELFEAERVQGQVTHKIRLRHLAGVRPKMRVLFEDRILNIHSVRNLEERERVTELLCREEV